MRINKSLCFLPLAVVLWLTGCATISPNNPLMGWKTVGDSGYVDIQGSCQAYISTIPFGKIVSVDVEHFIDELPIEKGRFANRRESYWIDNIALFEDGTGQRAVKIHIPLKGTYVNYVLFYDKAGSRTKVIKFSSGRYAC